MTYADTRALARKAGRDRVVIDGVDVTYFRDRTIATPRYALTEPFAYGATSLAFPQIHAGYEAGTFGTGELSWVRKGARVVISRVFDNGEETVDYRGVVVSINPDGRALTLDVGGEFSGPASLLMQETQLFRESIDVGRWASLAAATVGLAFEPWFGPVTGIHLTHAGGQSHLSWAQFVCAMSQDENGIQRAIMPTVWGGSTWGFAQKDYTTKHCTIFNDDARAVVQVTDDASEAPNVIYGTGITPDGERITNAKWPNVFAGPAPDYPIAGGASFGLGTTDADTIDGDGITVLYVKLREMSYLPFEVPNTQTYTSDFVTAVNKLKKDAGLTQNGTMNPAAWDALYDNNVTGYKINGAYIAPLAEADAVREWNRSGNGAILGRNPLYDPTVLRVERHIDFGSGITKAAMIAHAQGIINRSATFKNWSGTINLDGNGAFDGAHDDNTGLTDADLMSYRDIRPGMNVWLPYFDGGTLFHISGVDVKESGATLTVDTQARDLVEVSEILARNADSRRDVRREWQLANRGGKPSTAMIACDESFGWIDRKVALTGNTWNKVPVIAGQQGQVNRVRLELVNDKPEFAVAVTAKHYGRKWFNSHVGNPLTTAAESVWEKASLADEFENRQILYASGDGKQPCGYSPRRHRNDDDVVTDAPITGIHLDDSPWPYLNAAGTAVLLYVWIYPDRDCTLKKGRILYPQLDDAAG